MEWMLMPLKRYADFSGRSRRKEYWMFILFLLLLYAALLIVFAMMSGFSSDPGAGAGLPRGPVLIVLGILFLGLAVPSIAVQVRRFHDQDKSGWFVLLNFIPYLGGLVVLVFMCLEGTRGPNRFGADPKDPNHADVFA